MNLNWEVKPFCALSALEIYSVLKLRSEVFVVEQNCVYQDIDSKDQKALHLIASMDSSTVAYARLFRAGDYFAESSIGRVVVSEKFRSLNLGHELMEKAIRAIEEHFHTKSITISAQLYLQKFYEKHGFVVTSETYLEDDIPHIQMKLNG